MPDLKIDNTVAYFEALEKKLINQMIGLLDKYNRNATHKLRKSLYEGLVDLEYAGNGRLYFKIAFPDINGQPSYAPLVMDSKRNIKYRITRGNRGGIHKGIAAIQQWILDKGISVGEGSIRTPMERKTKVVKVNGKKQALINVSKKYMANTEASQKSNDKARLGFAIAIWNKIKKRGRVAAAPVNLLKPYQNLWTQKTFKKDLSKALKDDGLTFMRRYNGTSMIKIKM